MSFPAMTRVAVAALPSRGATRTLTLTKIAPIAPPISNRWIGVRAISETEGNWRNPTELIRIKKTSRR